MEKPKVLNAFTPENIRYVPLAAIGVIKGLAAMAIHELGRSPKELEQRAQASIQFYSTGEDNGTEPRA